MRSNELSHAGPAMSIAKAEPQSAPQLQELGRTPAPGGVVPETGDRDRSSEIKSEFPL
jgi:hypothetical protein